MKNYKLSFENYYSSISNGLIHFQQNEEFVDMTLAADGHLVQVHRNVVSLASPYIKEMIKLAPCPHPVVYLSNIKYNILCILLEYIYTGEVDVPDSNFNQFVQAAKELHIVGFSSFKKANMGIQDQSKTQLKSKTYVPNVDPPISIMNNTEDVNNAYQSYTSTAHSVNNAFYPTTQNFYVSLDSKPVYENTSDAVCLQDNAIPRTDDVNTVYNEAINTAGLETTSQDVSFNEQYLKFAEKNIDILPYLPDGNTSTQPGTFDNIVVDPMSQEDTFENIAVKPMSQQYTCDDIAVAPMSQQDTCDNTANEREIYEPNVRNEDKMNSQNNKVDYQITLNYSNKDIAPGDNNTEATNEISINLSEVVKSQKETKSEIILGKPMFTLSTRGQLQLIFNRFIYYYIFTTKKGKRKFKCIDYRDKKCPAIIVIENGLITQRKNMHCHEFHDTKIEQKIKAQILYENIEEADNASLDKTKTLKEIREIENNDGLDIEMDDLCR